MDIVQDLNIGTVTMIMPLCIKTCRLAAYMYIMKAADINTFHSTLIYNYG